MKARDWARLSRVGRLGVAGLVGFRIAECQIVNDDGRVLVFVEHIDIRLIEHAGARIDKASNTSLIKKRAERGLVRQAPFKSLQNILNSTPFSLRFLNRNLRAVLRR